jgi:alpha-L-rhamnosidase
MKRIIAILILITSLYNVQAQVSVLNLRTERQVNPSSISGNHPQLSWELSGNRRGIQQQAYEIVVASDPSKLLANQGDLWVSGKVNSNSSVNITYNGKPFKSNTTSYWKVKVWTNKGETAWSQSAQLGTGLAFYKDWEGRWIGFDQYFPWDSEKSAKLSARYFRKEFTTPKQVKSATAYVMGLGLYELYVNGKKIGDQVLAPAPTDYTQNVKYNVLDVTNELKQGSKHAIGVILGNGRFFEMRQSKAYKQKTFGFPKLLLNVIVKYTDGTSTTIKTDETWKGTADGAIRTNNEYDGEEYDARKEPAGWNQPGFDEKNWLKAEYVQEPGGTYEPQVNGYMKVMQDLVPVAIIKKGEGKYVIDLGQNMSGWVRMRVKGQAGQKVTLRFAESLEPDGSLFVANLRDAKATDTYTLKGGGTELWEPRFTYHGFRYVEVSGYPGMPSKNDFTGRFVYDEMQTVGTFESSNTLLNQIFKNSWWGIASNYKGMPVDCPQRNERQPWLGDRTIGCYGESFLFDNAALYTKWLDDIRYAQKADGAIPDVAPAFWRYYSDSMTWPGTYLFVADMVYQQTGDTAVIRNHYPAMKKWMQYMQSRYLNDEGILTKDSYGDWCVPPATIEAGKGVNADQKHPSQLIASAYYYKLLKVLTNFAHLTGNTADISLFTAQAESAKTAFNKKFYHEEGYYGENTLTDNLLPVAFDMVNSGNKEKLWKQVANIVEVKNKGHLSTGVVGTQWIMRGLTNIGRADLAYKVATQKTYPSWGYMIENGATAIWELWNGNTAAPKMNSQNHVMMLGDLLIWYYEDLAGIKAASPGFKIIEMKPVFPPGLTHVNAAYKSVQGLIKSNWTKDKQRFNWDVTVPANSKAIVYIPAASANQVTEGGKKAASGDGIKYIKMDNGRAVYEVGSGNYSFSVNL